MTKIDIFSGFLGAGKTTLIKKLITDAYKDEQLVLIENEFGEIGIDGGFLADAGIRINEMNSGCICCSLVGDFRKALAQVISQYHPDRILIEPSGVGKLSDVIRAVEGAATEGAVLNGFTTVVDAGKCKMYMKNFGEFFNDQVENAGCIIISHADSTPAKKVEEAVELLRAHNATAVIVSTPFSQLTGDQLREAMERRDTLEAELSRLAAAEEDEDEEEHEYHHHHHHDEDDGDEDEHEHHHHHHHDEDDDDECGCGCCHHDHEGHHHHHHHDADEVFVSCGAETTVRFDRAALEDMLTALCDEGKYGTVLRAKGIVAPADGRNDSWIHFDYVPGEPDVRTGAPAVIGRLCVIGSGLKVDALSGLFGVTLHKSEED